MLRCSYADKYHGIRPPTCGCQACADVYVIAKLEKIGHNELGDDPTLIRQLAWSMIEVIRDKK